MPLISEFNYSLNFNSKKRRLNQIKFIIFHYTGMRSESAAIKRLTNINSKVSSHYLVKNNGQIVVALIDDHEAMLKRIRKKGKVVALESANKRYETKIFGPDRVKVQGILVSLYRNFQ